MSLNETISSLKNFMVTDESFAFFAGNSREIINKSIRFIQEQINKAIKNEQVSISKNDLKTVEQILNLIVNQVVLENTTENYIVFVNNYILLVDNWNSIAKCSAVEQKVKVVHRLLYYHSSMTATAEAMKILLQEFKLISKYKPASFELSKAFLKELQNKYDNKK